MSSCGGLKGVFAVISVGAAVGGFKEDVKGVFTCGFLRLNLWNNSNSNNRSVMTLGKRSKSLIGVNYGGEEIITKVKGWVH